VATLSKTAAQYLKSRFTQTPSVILKSEFDYTQNIWGQNPYINELIAAGFG